MPKFEWDKLIRALPRESPLFQHRGCGSGCHRRDGSRLSPATLKHVAITLQTFANIDGTHAHPGIRTMTVATARHRSTVIAALAHLETVGLIAVHLRGGQLNVPRTFASDYYLTTPEYRDELAIVDLGSDDHDWFRPRLSRDSELDPPADRAGRHRAAL